MSAVMRYNGSEAVMVRSAVGMTDALQRERRGGPQGGASVDALAECASGGAPRRMCVCACTPDAVGG